ncbi:MAG TPA: hypothetical protein DCO75_07070 [Fibrobacteres bacterium]|nr:hypothetical protein [Fibrobacterota bacterium]
MVVDNGNPPMSDTDTVVITVSDTGSQKNKAPKWEDDTINLSRSVGSQIKLTLSDACSDPDGDTLTYTLLPGTPARDTIINGVWSFTPAASDTGTYYAKIVAKDPSGLSDTVYLHITITATDLKAPTMLLVTPVKDSSTVSTSSYPVSIKCYDPSGVSVKCSNGTDTFAVTKTDSIYTATVTSLTQGTYSTIMFIATDASVNANKDTLKVHIKYTPLVTDSVGPVITLVTPAKDSASTNSSSYAVTLTCTDASGVLSVNGVLGTTAFTGVRGTGNNWTITVNGLTANVFNTIIFTATDSSLRANKTMDTLYIKSVIVNPYTITFDKNDAAATGTMAAQTIAGGDSAALTANAFTKAGYSFAGWMTSATATTVAYADKASYTMGTANVTLYAKWTAIPTYSLTYDGNTNTGGAAPATVTGLVSGSVVTVATNSFTRTNYIFSAWNTKSDGSGDSYAPNTNIIIIANTTLYAIWTPTYSLTYNGNNNTGGTAPSTVTGLVSGSVQTVAANSFTRTNYTFFVWNTQSNGSGVSYAPGANIAITLNTTLYAQWTINTYSVHFDKNDNVATGSMLTQSIQSGSSATLLPVGFSKSCYDFTGWATSASGAVVYQDQGSITMGSGDIYLYAIWTAKPALTLSTLQNVDWYCGNTSPVSYSVQVTGATGNPSYTWWYDSSGTSRQCSTMGSTFHGYSSATLTIYPQIIINSTSLWCVVTDNCNSKETNHATYHQHPVASLPDSINGTCYSSIDLSLSVDCGGSHKWYISGDGTYTGGTAIADMDTSLIALLTYSGYNTSTLHIGQLDSENDAYYFCEVTEFGETVRSNICKLSGPNGAACP